MWVPRVFTVGAPDFSTLADAVDRVRTFPCRPADVTLRYGLVGVPDRMLTL
jgi:hypothetical protein